MTDTPAAEATATETPGAEEAELSTPHQGGSNIERNASTDTDRSLLEPAPQEEEDYFPEKYMKDGEKDYDALAKGYKELENHMRSTRATGAKDVGEYEFDFGDFPLDEGMTNSFKEEALKNGVSAEQYKWMMGKYMDEMARGAQQSHDAAQSVLQAEWGDNFDGNLQNAHAAWQTFGEGLDINEVGNNPTALRLLAKIGAELQEDSVNVGSPGPSPANLSDTEIKELMSRPDYWTNREVQKQVASAYARRRNER